MKDIIRQAVADAAEWLHIERGVSANVLWATLPRNIVEAAKDMRKLDAENRRKDQLADFVAKPRIDNVLITGPGGFVAHGAGLIGRTVMVELTPGPDGKLSAREAPIRQAMPYAAWMAHGKAIHGRTGGSDEGYKEWVAGEDTASNRARWSSMGPISTGYAVDTYPYNKRRAEVADHALAIWLRDGCSAWFLRNAEPNDILKLSLEKSGRDFNKDVELPAPSDPIWSVAVKASFDGAEGEGRVWLSAEDDNESMIAIEGRQNAATLASMLIDWVRPDVVVVPRALLERLAKIENIPNNEDQGPGYDACPDCGRCGNWQWKAGKVISKAPIEHDADCVLSELRKLL